MTTARAFVDTSIMQGVVEFQTACGQSKRYVRESRGVYGSYSLRGDCYIRTGVVCISGKPTPMTLWDAELENA